VPILENGSVLNDQDAMRLGFSGTSLSDASCQVFDNFFYDWNGEVEIISNKSCRNKYYNNTFRKCVGTLTLRHGTYCEVYGNFFFGENLSKSGGVRIIDSNHKIFNNYFQDLKTGGSKVVGAINLFKGDADFVIDGVLSSYAPNEDNLVTNNTIVNCDKGIWIGPDDSGREYPPKNIEIVNNLMINCTDAVSIGTAPTGSNIYKGNIRRNGAWWTTFNTSDNLVASADLTVKIDEIDRLTQTSEAISFAKAITNLTQTSFTLTKDIFGGNRDANPDAGAEEYGATGTQMPYKLSDVGVLIGAGVKNNSTAIGTINKSDFGINIFPNPTKETLNIESDFNIKELKLYELSGKLVNTKSQNSLNKQMVLNVSEINKGSYVLEICLENNQKTRKLVIIN